MFKRKKLLLATLVAILLLGILPLAALAQGQPAPPDPVRAVLRALVETAAQTLHMEPQDLVQALRQGQTPAELAADAGVSTEELAAALQATWNEQGEKIIARFIEQGLPPHRGHRGSGRAFKHMKVWVRISAKTLDMPVRDFLQAMREGQTPEQIATDHGSSGQALIDAITAAEKDRLDQAVARGRLTQEQADDMLARLSQKVETWVTQGFPRPHPNP